MIKYKLLKDNGFTPKSITKNKNAYIIDTENGKYVIKKDEAYLNKTYNYLLARGFNYYPNYYKLDNYMIYDYIPNLEEDKNERLQDLMYLISLLHLKTTRYTNIDIADYKEIYENLMNKVNDLYDYYTKLNDEIDSEIYMSPSFYLLARNISTVYSALSFSKEELGNWYDKVKKKDKQRKVLIHNNLDISHIRKNNSPYLISFRKSKVDYPIYDLYNLYKKYNDLDFDNLFNIYQKKYPLNSDELILFFILISLPDKIIFTNDEYNNTILVKNMLSKLFNSDKLIRPYYQKKKLENNKT